MFFFFLAGETSECADVLTCGMCQKDFLLADILRFIQHKVTCQTPPPSGGCRNVGNLSISDHSEHSPPHTGRPRSRDHNGDLNHSDSSDPAFSSPKNLSIDGEDTKIEDKRKRDEDDDVSASARKKPRSTQDAEANTVDSGKYFIISIYC